MQQGNNNALYLLRITITLTDYRITYHYYWHGSLL
jgi:hypothetical protein